MNKERPPVNLFFILIPAVLSSVITSNSYLTAIPSLILIIYSYFNKFHFPRNSFNSTMSCLMLFGVSLLLHVFIITDIPTGNGPHVMAASMIVLMVYLWYYQNPKITTGLIVLLSLLVMIFTGNNINDDQSNYKFIIYLFIPMVMTYLFSMNRRLSLKNIVILLSGIFIVILSSNFFNKFLFFADDKLTYIFQKIIQDIDYSTKQGFSNQLDIQNQVDLKLSKKPVLLLKSKKISYLRSEVLVNYSRKSWTGIQKSSGEGVSIDINNQKLITYDRDTANSISSQKDKLVSGTIEFLDKSKYLPLPINTYAFSSGNYKVKPYRTVVSQKELNSLEFYTLNTRTFKYKPESDEKDLEKDIRNSLIALSNKITAKDKDNLSKAQSILNYFQDYKYSLKVDFASDKEPIVDFIFNNKSGFCLHFASAMALMLRSIDIPAHLVSGYIVNEYDSNLEAYVIRERDAHAWVEVYNNKDGNWVTFDPTPSSQMDPYMNSDIPVFDQISLYTKSFFNKLKSYFTNLSIENLRKIGTSPYSLIILLIATVFIIFRNHNFKQEKNVVSRDTKIFLDKINKILKEYKVEFHDNMTYNELIENIEDREDISEKVKQKLIIDLNEYQLKKYKEVRG